MTDLQKIKNLSFDTAANIQKSFQTIGTAAVGMLGAFAAAMSVAIDKTTTYETHILHLSQSTGLSTESLSGLSLAAKSMGLDIDTVATSMERFEKNLLLVQSGHSVGVLKEVFGSIDLKQMTDANSALAALADKFSKMPDGMLKSAEAQALFGRAGAQWIPVLNQGAKGLQQFTDDAQLFGLAVSQSSAEAAEHFEQNMKLIESAHEGMWRSIVDSQRLSMNEITDQLVGGAKNAGGMLKGIGDFISAARGWPFQSPEQKQKLLDLENANDAAAAKMRGRAEAIGKIKQANEEDAAAAKKLQQAIDDQAASLEFSYKTFGMTNDQIEIYKLKVQGASAAVLENIRSLQSAIGIGQAISDLGDKSKGHVSQNALAAPEIAGPSLGTAPDLSFIGADDQQIKMEKVASSVKDVTDQLQHQIATYQMAEGQATLYDLAQAGATADQLATIKALQDQYQAMGNATLKATQAQKQVQEAMKQGGDLAYKSLSEVIFSGERLTKILSDLVKQMGELALKWALFGAGGGKEGFGGTGGGIVGGVFGTLMKTVFGAGGGSTTSDNNVFPLAALGAFASGGSVTPDVPILVGEQGPELFVPPSRGYVMPNSAMGSAGGSNVQNFNIDARGAAPGMELRIRQQIQASQDRAVARSLAYSREARLRKTTTNK